jgi:hypothetical protein
VPSGEVQRGITNSGSVDSGALGASTGTDVFQNPEGRVSVVCGHGHPSIGNAADIEVENTTGHQQTLWITRTTGGGTTLASAVLGQGGTWAAGTSDMPQTVVIQAVAGGATFTSTVSTSYDAAIDSASSATCAWVASTTFAGP